MATSACFLISRHIVSCDFNSMPPVSTIEKARPRHSASAYSLSRVTPGLSSVIEIFLPATLLKKVLLPTFGLPTMATSGFDIFYLLEKSLTVNHYNKTAAFCKEKTAYPNGKPLFYVLCKLNNAEHAACNIYYESNPEDYLPYLCFAAHIAVCGEGYRN